MLVSCRCLLDLEYLRLDFSFDSDRCYSCLAGNEYAEILQYCQVENMKVKVDEGRKNVDYLRPESNHQRGNHCEVIRRWSYIPLLGSVSCGLLIFLLRCQLHLTGITFRNAVSCSLNTLIVESSTWNFQNQGCLKLFHNVAIMIVDLPMLHMISTFPVFVRYWLPK